MMVRKIRGAALALGVLLSLCVAAAPALACEGAECRTAGKSFDLKKFMRAQAASTRTPEAMRATRGKVSHRGRTARSGGAHGKIAQAHYPRHRTVKAARHSQPVEAPRDMVLAFAEQGSTREDPNVQMVSADELNDIDRAAGQAPAETTGNAPAPARDVLTVAQDVQTVAEKDFNDIDRKVAELVPPADPLAATTSKVTRSAPAITWMQWLWSVIGAGFVVLAGVARYLLA